MIITQIAEVTKKRCKIYLDETFAFVLYKGEIRKYGIRVNEELSGEAYTEIVEEVLPKRAKLRGMNLLKSREYTEKQLRDKLRSGYFPEKIVEEAVEYIKSYHYIDDERYARQFIEFGMNKKSRQRIVMDLQKRGIDKELINRVFEELEEDGYQQDEIGTIKELLIKKKFDAKQSDNAEKQRVFGYLYRRGFQVDNIKKAMDFSPFA